MISLERLETVLDRFADQRIGLIGDLFLDRYLEVDPALTEVSIETSLEAHQVTAVRNCPGALGTVINNLQALGVQSLLPVTVIGNDGHGYDLLHTLKEMGVDTRYILQDEERLTPTYTKPMTTDEDGLPRELNRLDVRTRAGLSSNSRWRLFQSIRQTWDMVDGWIVLDQIPEDGQGVIDAQTRDFLAEMASSDLKKLMFVDSRINIDKFRQGILKTNDVECLQAVGAQPTEDLNIIQLAAKHRAAEKGLHVFCTLGPRGILVASPDGEPTLMQGYPAPEPIDIVGAGDSATSGIVASLLAGASFPEASDIGNLVASITVQQIGTTGTATPSQVLFRWRQTH